ncbi:hypothetical protein PORCRE_1252 [Porphyromonas crevioricanis JCM 15906]|uniref:Uncharacterized protein n=1 Tax=Porphyromonas crevioricanis JCM 15906 TaxID=1305617 RepID=T1CNX8_9PORP|nr:hypothetical protein PORCRE_1252 [Porphyromonas crevioricanis JCM 15906]
MDKKKGPIETYSPSLEDMFRWGYVIVSFQINRKEEVSVSP